MWKDRIIFTLTAAPRDGGEQIFRSSVEQIMGNGAGAASFSSIEIAESAAVLRGEIAGDRRMVTERGLAEYLEDILASKEAIHLDLDVRIEARGLPLPAARAAALAA
jgi:hypothetical protein